MLARAGFHVLDIWHRQLFLKNSVRYPFYRFFEALDQGLVQYTPLKYFATNIEFVAMLPQDSKVHAEDGSNRS
jgi:hypothetical protein